MTCAFAKWAVESFRYRILWTEDHSSGIH
jgi:hypothetical protein